MKEPVSDQNPNVAPNIVNIGQEVSDNFVSMYLKQRGYDQSSSVIGSTIGMGSPTAPLGSDNDNIFKRSYFQYAKEESDLQNRYGEMYRKLRKWINNSIPAYKIELRLVLFPLFVYIYLALVSVGNPEARSFIETYGPEHSTECGDIFPRLVAITEPHHTKESLVAQNFIKNKYTVRMLSYSLQLLLSFLHYNRMMPILHILNEHININVTHTAGLDPNKKEQPDASETGFFGSDAPSVNSRSINLDPPPIDSSMIKNMELYIKDKKPEDILILTEEIKKLKSENKVVDYSDQDASSDIKNYPIACAPSKVIDVEAQLEIFRASRNRVALSSKVLPSICFYTFLNTYEGLNTLTLSPEMDYISAGFSDSHIKVWDIKGEKSRTDGRFTHNSGGNCAQKSSENTDSSVPKPLNHQDNDDNPSMHSAKETDNLINEGFLFAPRPGTSVRLIGHSGPVYSTSFSADQRYLLSCSSDLTVRLWSLDLMKNLVVYRGHNYPIWDVEFSPQNWYFATASHDHTARVWSCAHPKQIRTLVGHLSDVETVKFHPNGNYLATGSADRTCQFWDINYGSRVRIFCYHKAPIQALAVSPDGKYLATAGVDKDVVLWDIGMGKHIMVFSGHTKQIYTLAFSRESSILASGGADETVRLWDVKNTSSSNNSCLGIYPTKSTPIYNLEFTRKNLLISMGAFNPRIKHTDLSK